MKTIEFSDEIGYKAEKLLQKRSKCNFKIKFEEAHNNFVNNPDPIMKALSSYNLYLFYNHGWGVTSKNEALALEYLKSSTKLGYPVAGMDLARHYLKEKSFFKDNNFMLKAEKCILKAEKYILKCSEEFFKRKEYEQDKYQEEYKDMMQLLDVIKSEAKDTENLSDEESVGPEEDLCFNISISTPKNRFNKSPRL